VAAGWDLMVVDEAHHLAWSPEQSSPEYDVVEQLSGASQGLLLLTATPEQIGVASHFARLRLLDPARFHNLETFREEEQHYEVINQVVRRLQQAPDTISKDDRQALAGWLGDELDELLARDDAHQAVIDALLDRHGTGRVLFRNTRAAIQGFPERQPLPEPLPCPDLYEHHQYGVTGLAPWRPSSQWMKKTGWLRIPG
jgi:ATP-dependent helicase HepA